MTEEQYLEEQTATLGKMLEHACLRNDGTKEFVEVVVKRFALFEKLKDKEEVELTKDENEFLKQLVCEAYDTFFAGTILKLLS